LANIKSSAKRARQNPKLRLHNRYYGTTLRTYLKRARTQIGGKQVAEAETTVRLATKTLDKAAQKGIIHRNKAARTKSRLMKALNKIKA